MMRVMMRIMICFFIVIALFQEANSQACTASNIGATCNDYNTCTTNDICNSNLVCVGTRLPSLSWCASYGQFGNDGVCLANPANTWYDCVLAVYPGQPCNDNNACTSNDIMRYMYYPYFPSPLGCQGTPIIGQVCDDYNACTVNETCQFTGQCVGTVLSNGTICGGDGICSYSTCVSGACNGILPYTNGIPCDDGSDCTVNTTCQSGQCIGKNKPQFSLCDIGYDVPCQVNECFSGTCSTTYQTSGTVCSENNCTVTKCSSGTCNEIVNKTNGTQCDDGNSCTRNDTCHNGLCYGVSLNQTMCNDGNLCTFHDMCQNGTCIGVPINGTVSCDDGNLCTRNDTCQHGICLGISFTDLVTPCQTYPADDPDCDNPRFCPSSQCYPKCVNGKCIQTGDPCNDGNACTYGDYCNYEYCYGTLNCPTTECQTVTSCSTVNGICVSQFEPCPTVCYSCVGGVCTQSKDETPCSDGNPCTLSDHCMQGVCVAGALSAGACDDADNCTIDDTCTNAACTGTVPTAYHGLPCDDHNPCTFGEYCWYGGCLYPNLKLPDGSACVGNDLCTEDVCIFEMCLTGPNKTCPADQCHYPGNCSKGVCSNPKPDNTTCNDQNPCTLKDMCKAGVCSGSMMTCTALDQCHIAGTCINGVCTNPYKQDNTTCDDQNLCTYNDKCKAGVCNGTLMNCTAHVDQCHFGTCSMGVCSYPPIPDNTSCNDLNSCTFGDVCKEGICIGIQKCTALDPCNNVGNCTNGVCSTPPKADNTPCNDLDPCTLGKCKAGTCYYTLINCTALDQCHSAGICTYGACSNPPKPDNTACNDQNSCTIDDICSAGVCSGTLKNCTALDQCHSVGTCTNGACSNPPKPDTTSCNDQESCTNNDTCKAGICSGISICTALDQCHSIGTCTNSICSNPPQPDNTLCDDQDPCTNNDMCSAGTCSGSSICTDLGPCSDASCNQLTALCSYQNKTDGTTCDDGISCTTDDGCFGGICFGTIKWDNVTHCLPDCLHICFNSNINTCFSSSPVSPVALHVNSLDFQMNHNCSNNVTIESVTVSVGTLSTPFFPQILGKGTSFAYHVNFENHVCEAGNIIVNWSRTGTTGIVLKIEFSASFVCQKQSGSSNLFVSPFVVAVHVILVFFVSLIRDM